MWLFQRRTEKKTTHDLAKADESLKQAKNDRREQEQKLVQEGESVIGRWHRIQEQNNISILIRRALQQRH